ncbi:transcriptional regulator Myc-A-like [Bombina bombina]|uniref:transcriptional regulator Myc-A-like n=1 Tax=Bombina bombina TaxID=8345 RepID=UPI00235AD84B|nr:transcriptional regulator Myc-A-like [Bombina bombina]
MALDSSSQSQNYDYDSMQPYFYFEEEQQQHSRLQPPAPSEEIWKKFELFTTPPVSPSHRSSLSSLVLSSEDQLEMVTEFLGGDMVNPSFIHEPDDETSANSIIIQDCMWSGFSAAAKSEKVVSEKLPSYQLSRKEGSLSSHNQPQQQILQKTHSGHESPVRSSHSHLQDLSSGCIDPSVGFPCPVSATISKANPTHLVKDLTMDTPPIRSDSNSSTPPISSDRNSKQDDEPDHEEDKDETGVVTIEKRQLASKKAELSSCSQRSQLHRSPALKRCHVCNDQHNYAATPSTKADYPSSKRTRLESKTRVLDKVSNHSKCTSPRTPGQKRSYNTRSHNVLERKRRKELRLSFIALRDQIPEIAHNEKASTLVILKKATEYILSKREDERWLSKREDERWFSREVDKLRMRNKQLKQKLNQLRKFGI